MRDNVSETQPLFEELEKRFVFGSQKKCRTGLKKRVFDEFKKVLIMSKRFDKHFPKMDLILKNMVFHSKTFDEIPFYFDEPPFWHY
jgi:hypothetical protein